jgi:hypothetical protein
MIRWGVDSLLPANSQLLGVPGKPLLYDFVVSKLGRAPAFWGRYVVGAPNHILTQGEVDFLFSKTPACRILPIYNRARITLDFAAGRQDAKDAVKACTSGATHQLHVPDRVFVYADIEPTWKPTKEWILGWWDGMWNSRLGGVGGLYCNAHPINTFFNNPYCKALNEAQSQLKHGNIAVNSLLWGQTPARGCDPNPAGPLPSTRLPVIRTALASGSMQPTACKASLTWISPLTRASMPCGPAHRRRPVCPFFCLAGGKCRGVDASSSTSSNRTSRRAGHSPSRRARPSPR